MPHISIPPKKPLLMQRWDLMRSSTASAGCLLVYPRSKKHKARLALCDLAGVAHSITVDHKMQISANFTTTGTTQGITAATLYADQLFLMRGSTIEAYNKKGRLFFTVDTHTTEPIHTVFVDTPFFFTAGDFMMTAFQEGRELGFYMSPDKVMSMVVFTETTALTTTAAEDRRMEDFLVCLGCSDRCLRVVKNLELVQEEACEASLSSMHFDGLKRYIYYGTPNGSIGAFKVLDNSQLRRVLNFFPHAYKAPAPPGFSVSSSSNARTAPLLPPSTPPLSRSCVRSLSTTDMTGDGHEDLVVGYDDGTVTIFAIVLAEGSDRKKSSSAWASGSKAPPPFSRPRHQDLDAPLALHPLVSSTLGERVMTVGGGVSLGEAMPLAFLHLASGGVVAIGIEPPPEEDLVVPSSSSTHKHGLGETEDGGLLGHGSGMMGFGYEGEEDPNPLPMPRRPQLEEDEGPHRVVEETMETQTREIVVAQALREMRQSDVGPPKKKKSKRDKSQTLKVQREPSMPQPAEVIPPVDESTTAMRAASASPNAGIPLENHKNEPAETTAFSLPSGEEELKPNVVVEVVVPTAPVVVPVVEVEEVPPPPVEEFPADLEDEEGAVPPEWQPAPEEEAAVVEAPPEHEDTETDGQRPPPMLPPPVEEEEEEEALVPPPPPEEEEAAMNPATTLAAEPSAADRSDPEISPVVVATPLLSPPAPEEPLEPPVDYTEEAGEGPAAPVGGVLPPDDVVEAPVGLEVWDPEPVPAEEREADALANRLPPPTSPPEEPFSEPAVPPPPAAVVPERVSTAPEAASRKAKSAKKAKKPAQGEGASGGMSSDEIAYQLMVAEAEVQQLKQLVREKTEALRVARGPVRGSAPIAAVAATFEASVSLLPISNAGKPMLRLRIEATLPLQCAIVQCHTMQLPLEGGEKTHVSNEVYIASTSPWNSVPNKLGTLAVAVPMSDATGVQHTGQSGGGAGSGQLPPGFVQMEDGGGKMMGARELEVYISLAPRHTELASAAEGSPRTEGGGAAKGPASNATRWNAGAGRNNSSSSNSGGDSRIVVTQGSLSHTIRRPGDVHVVLYSATVPRTAQTHTVSLVALPFYRRVPHSEEGSSSATVVLDLNSPDVSYMRVHGAGVRERDVYLWLTTLLFDISHDGPLTLGEQGFRFVDEVNDTWLSITPANYVGQVPEGVPFAHLLTDPPPLAGTRNRGKSHNSPTTSSSSQNKGDYAVLFASTSVTTLQIIKQNIMTSAKARETLLEFDAYIHFSTVEGRLRRLAPMVKEVGQLMKDRLLWSGLQDLAAEDPDDDDGEDAASHMMQFDLQDGSIESNDPEHNNTSRRSALPAQLLDVLRRGPTLTTPSTEAHLRAATAHLLTAVFSEYEDLVQFKAHAPALCVGGRELAKALEEAAASPHAKEETLRLLFFPQKEHEFEAIARARVGGSVLAADVAEQRAVAEAVRQREAELEATTRASAAEEEEEEEDAGFQIPRGPISIMAADEFDEGEE